MARPQHVPRQQVAAKLYANNALSAVGEKKVQYVQTATFTATTDVQTIEGFKELVHP